MTRLILPGDGTVEQLTAVRETDARTALARGLAEYISEQKIVAVGGRPFAPTRVLYTWAEVEDVLKSVQDRGPDAGATLPLGVVYVADRGRYEDNALTPTHVELPNDPAGRSLLLGSEFSVNLLLNLYAADIVGRMWLSAMIEDAFLSQVGLTGVRLELPHYFNQRADFRLLDSAYSDDEAAARRRLRVVSATVEARVRHARLVTLPNAIPIPQPFVNGIPTTAT